MARRWRFLGWASALSTLALGLMIVAFTNMNHGGRDVIRPPSDPVADFIHEPDYRKVRSQVIGWSVLPKREKVRILRDLHPWLRNAAPVRLENTAGLTWVRRDSIADIDWPNSVDGKTIRQDLRVAGGRAAWAINEIIGNAFPPSIYSQTPSELEQSFEEIDELILHFITFAS